MTKLRTARNQRAGAAPGDRYKWVALANTTASMFMATLDGSIVIIALPAIFRGIHLDPLAPGSISYLLWMIMGYRLVQAVLVVTVGRLGDMFGRVRIYNSGFVVFTVASILLSDPFTGGHGALWLIGWRLLQAVGGSMLMANSAAILTDAFPAEQRGFALGTNQVAGLAGMFVGLVAGGLLAAIDWRWVFWVNVPVGVYGTIWAYLQLRDNGERHPACIDWWGNITFAVGLSAVLIAVTYGIQPHGGHTMGWTSPWVLAGLAGGSALLAAFVILETRIEAPMFQLSLFRIRAFTAGNLAGLAVAIARGGLQFMLIIWLQGIWLPLHGYDYSQTPLWAGIFLLPLTAGFLVSGPVAGFLSDKFGSRGIATAGMAVFGGSFIGLMLLPVNFPYPAFALLIALNGIGSGMFARAQLLLDHGQRPGQPARRGLGHALDLPELRHRVVDRRVLLGHDRRAGQPPPGDAGQRPAPAGRRARRRAPGRRPAAGVVTVRRGPRREPARPPAGRPRRPGRPPGRGPADPHRPGVLPRPHLRPVPARPGHRVRPGRPRHPGVVPARRPPAPANWD
jgi:MFS family permease